MAELSAGSGLLATEALKAVLAGSRSLSGDSFEGAALDGALLSGVSFNRVRFSGCSFSGAWFTGADLRGCVFSRCDFSRASLRGADLRGASLTDCRLDLCDLSSAKLDGAQLSRVSLRAALLAGTRFGAFELLEGGAGLRFSDLSQTRFESVDLSYAVLQGLDFEGQSLSSVRGLHDALLLDCSLQGCDLPALLEPGPLAVERIAGGILGGGMLGGDRRLWQELPALMAQHGVDFWQRLEPPFLQLPPPLWRWPLSQLALLFTPRDYGRVLRTYSTWCFKARRSLAALKNAYLEQSNNTMASRLAYSEKELERRALWPALLDDLLRLLRSSMVLALALLALYLMLLRWDIGWIALGSLLLVGLLAQWRQIGPVLSAPRQWLSRLRRLPVWLIDLPRRSRLGRVYEALHDPQARPSAVADLLSASGHELPRSRLERWVLRLSSGGLLSLLLALLLALPAAVLTLLSASGQHFAQSLLDTLLAFGRLLSSSFWMLSCGYGERPGRVVLTGLSSILVFSAVYLWLGLPVYEQGQVMRHYSLALNVELQDNQQLFSFLQMGWDGWKHGILVSAQAFAGMGFSMLGDPRYELQNFIGVLECFWGLFLSAMLIWSLGRKIQAY